MNDYDAYAEIWAGKRRGYRIVPPHSEVIIAKRTDVFSLDYFKEIDCYIRHWLFMPRMESVASMKFRWRNFNMWAERGG